MPTYEYVCQACKHEFEKEQRITEAAVKKCPKCKKMKVRRMVGTGNFILKGSGWYSDLYSGASNKPKESEKKEGSEDSKKESKGESKEGSSKGDGASKESSGKGDKSAAKDSSSKAKSESSKG